MKKSLIALAVLAASGAAMAQSSVTMFGVLDIGVSYLDGQDDVTGLSRGGLTAPRLGFRGVEDLGNGLKVGFWLEGEPGADGTGGGTDGFNFKRRSTLSLMSSWGEIRMGRDQTATYQVSGGFDPFGDTGIGKTLVNGGNAGNNIGGNSTRKNNTIAYFLPDGWGGVYGRIQYAFGENGTDNEGNMQSRTGFDDYVGIHLGWKNDKLDVAGSYGQTDHDTNSAWDATIWNLGISYDLGMVKPFAVYQLQEDDAGSEYRSWLIGLTAPVGQNGVLRFSYADMQDKSDNTVALRFGDAQKWAIGYVHNLSKRTAMYATYAYIDNDDGATYTVQGAGLTAPGVNAGRSSQGLEIGVRHSF